MKKIIRNNRAMAVLSMLIGAAGILCCCTDTTQAKRSVVPVSITEQQFAGLQDIVEVAILGSGPAGSSAALYAARAGKKPVVITGDEPGGLLIKTGWVENMPGRDRVLGPELVAGLQKQAEQFGAVYLNDTVNSVDVSQWPYVLHTEEGRILRALTVIIATGASPRKLGVPGEEQYWGSGVTTCAVCDAPFYKGKNVVVIGGGDSAVEEAMQLAPYAKNITVLVRKDKMRASAHMQKLLTDFSNITVEYNKEIHEILGNGSKVTGVKLFDNSSKKIENRPIDGVFLAIGHEPNTQLFNNDIETDKLGYIVVQGRGQKTSQPGIFAAGDVEDHTYRQAGVAAGSGIKAALDSDMFLNQHGYTAELSKKLENQLFDVLTTRSKVKFHLVRTLEELEQLQASSSLPLIVDISAEWCPSCVQLMPLFESAMQEYGDKLTFVRVDADESSDILERHRVEYLPTLLVFKGKTLVNRSTGAMTRSGLDTFIRQSLEKAE